MPRQWALARYEAGLRWDGRTDEGINILHCGEDRKVAFYGRRMILWRGFVGEAFHFWDLVTTLMCLFFYLQLSLLM
jgi:hypothetical protein